MNEFILYLHGFNSSPESWKARALQAWMAEQGCAGQLLVPAVPENPQHAEQALLQLTQDLCAQHDVTLIGSSLGGFYATWLAETFDCKAVLVNPAVKPHELLSKYLGENSNYHTGKTWTFTREDVDVLARLQQAGITKPERYYVLLQTGDETLDYRQAADYYAAASPTIEQGGDHAFTGFERYFEKIMTFAGIVPA